MDLDEECQRLGITRETLQRIAKTLHESQEGIIGLLRREEATRKRETVGRRKKRIQKKRGIATPSQMPELEESFDSDDEDFLDFEEVDNMDRLGVFSAVSEERKDEISKECREALMGDFMDISSCAGCDELIRLKNSSWVSITDAFVNICLKRLRPRSLDLSEGLVSFYNISALVPALKGALLSPRSKVKMDAERKRRSILMCVTCLKSLHSPSVESLPPKFSIANGFEIGEVPSELKMAAPPEIWLTSLASVSPPISIVRGGRHRSIKGHVVIFDSNPCEVVNKISSIVQGLEKFVVIFTSPLTTTQEKLIRRRYAVRKSMLESLMNHLMKHHLSYKSKNMVNNAAKVRQICSLVKDAVVLEKYGKECSPETPTDKCSISNTGIVSSELEELHFHEEYSILVDDEERSSVETLSFASKKVLDVQRFGCLLSDRTTDIMARVFPDLFPYGTGHPGCWRPKKVSFEQCIRHYVKLSSQSFSQHPWFPLISFDMLSRRRALERTSFLCKIKPWESSSIASVTAEDLSAQLQKNANRKLAMRNGIVSFSIGEECKKGAEKGTANVLLRKVDAVSGRCFGTNEERRIYQRQVWSMAARYRGAAMFATMTPNENGSATVSFYAGTIQKENLRKLDMCTFHPSHSGSRFLEAIPTRVIYISQIW